MIPDQRHLFDIPESIAYLNCAYTAPMLRSAARAGEEAIEAKKLRIVIVEIANCCTRKLILRINAGHSAQ